MLTNLPNFRKPPINEVAMGVRFAPIEGLVLTHFGLFWSSLKDEFGKGQDATPLSTPEGVVMSKASGLPLPRVWLVHNNEQYLIQLQSNIFYFNWRQRTDDDLYPRYASIKPMFYKYLDSYFEFLVREKLPKPAVVNCDLTYINIIPSSREGELGYEFGQVFPDINWRQEGERFLTAPKALNWRATFDIEDSIELTANVQKAKRALDNLPILRFEIIARDKRSNSPLNETEAWFDRAHKAIVSSFVDLTSTKIQRELWERFDDPS